MPRKSQGPRLVPVRKKGWNRDVYYIRWTEGGNTRERSTRTSDRRRAEEEFFRWLAERTGQPDRTGPSHPYERLIADVLADYGLEHAAQTADPKRIGQIINNLLDFWGNRAADSIRPETCRAYSRHRQSMGRADGTIRRELACLRAALSHDTKEGRLVDSPYVWMPDAPPGRDRWLNRQEAAQLLNAARTMPRSRLHLPLFILIALYTGARRGAILDLRWHQVDLIRGRVNFNPPERKQTVKRRPIIPIPRQLLWHLRKVQARASSEYVISYHGERVLNLKKSFRAAARKAGLDGIGTHVLRHTAATWMAQSGVSLWEIAGYLGHTTARSTELYAQHSPEYLQKAKEALER